MPLISILTASPQISLSRPINLERALRRRHWYDCAPKQRAVLERQFLSLASVDFRPLRAACLAYVHPRNWKQLTDVENDLRQYDVAVLARAKYFDAYQRSKGKWFGFASVFADTGGWTKKQGKLRLVLSRTPLLCGPGYDAIAELDYLHRV